MLVKIRCSQFDNSTLASINIFKKSSKNYKQMKQSISWAKWHACCKSQTDLMHAIGTQLFYTCDSQFYTLNPHVKSFITCQLHFTTWRLAEEKTVFISVTKILSYQYKNTPLDFIVTTLRHPKISSKNTKKWRRLWNESHLPWSMLLQ